MSDLVLVVEDHPFVRKSVRDLLIAQGLTVVTAEDVATASRMLLARDAHFSLLVTDIHLPDGNGWAVARAARSAWPQLNVIYMSAEHGWDFADQAVPRSAFVAKPFDGRDLEQALSCLGVCSSPVASAA